MAAKIRHLLDRDGRYFARLVVPPRLRPYLPGDDKGRTELRSALGSDRRTAVARLPSSVARLQHKLGLARLAYERATGERSERAAYPLPVDEIAALDYRSQIDFDAELRAVDHRYALAEIDADVARRFRDGFAGKLSDAELDELVGHRVRRAALRGHTAAKKGSLEWRALAQALCLTTYEAMQRAHERSEGDFTGEPRHPLLAKAGASQAADAPHVTFKSIIDSEVKRRARGRDAKPLPPATVKKYRQAADDFAKFRKSDNAATVSASEGQSWIEAMQEAGELGNRTIGDKFKAVRTILNWGRSADAKDFLPAGNPLASIRTPDFHTTPSYLRSFTMAEAALVLGAARKESAPIFRWVPWLCAYSGMRVSEAGALRKEDFFKHGGRWFWRVTTAGNRTLKTISSERRIPVHPALIDEGLIDFVEASTAGRLFRGATKEDVNVQPRLSAWLRALIPYADRPELSPNHGWRHLFEDLCRRDHVPEDARNYITGRTTGASRDHYGRSEVMLPGLAAAMDKITPLPVSEIL